MNKTKIVKKTRIVKDTRNVTKLTKIKEKKTKYFRKNQTTTWPIGELYSGQSFAILRLINTLDELPNSFLLVKMGPHPHSIYFKGTLVKCLFD